MKSRQSTNPNLNKLIISLKKAKKDIWKRVASDLEKPRRQRRIVKLDRINRNCGEKEIALVPGKVLSDGNISKKFFIIHGDNDLFVPKDDSLKLHKTIKNSELLMLSNTGHQVQYARPDIIIRTIKKAAGSQRQN